MRIVAALALLSAASLPAAGQTPQTIWEGASGGYSIRWTTVDLTAQKAGSSVSAFSAKQLAARGYQAFEKAMADEGPCTYERKFTVISVVGPLIGLRDSYYSSCGVEAHPSIASRLTTIDLSKPGGYGYSSDASTPLEITVDKPGKAARLSDLFPEKDIGAALKNDPVVKQEADDAAPTLGALLKGLFGDQFEIAKNPCKQSMPPDILTRFAIHHPEGANVAVRVALAPVGGACQSSPPAELGLPLPQPERLREALRLADSRKEGWMQSGAAIPHGTTEIKFQFAKKR